MGVKFTFSKLLVFVLAALLPLALVAPAHAASNPKVSIKASAASVAPGRTVSFTGAVTKKSAGASVSLQRLDGSTWVHVASGKVSKKKKFSVTSRAPSGAHAYRIRVIGSKKIKTAFSKSVRVTGLVGVSVSPAMVGATFSVTAQRRSFVSRPVEVQQRVGNAWVNLATGTSSTAGVVVARASLSESAVVRVHAPAATVSG
ncbi:MAG: hypothetical protein GX678_03275, partial [Actinomycetales bacterium]|nr:hypothetical protein [Actinomycetales bacterium]